MRKFSALVAALALAATLVVASEAVRVPSPSERTAVGRAVLVQLERDTPDVLVTVGRVAISTKPPGAGSVYTRFAIAHGLGRDRSGRLVGSPISALVGLSRRFHTWAVVDYGSTEVGCRERQVYFGGRRAAILRDLSLGCP